jgi:Fe-S cluster assembly protein SufD
MSLALALRSGSLEALPGRRDEDWRWSDLRAALEVLPPPSPPAAAPPRTALTAGFTGAERAFVNGRAAAAPPGPAEGRLLRRFISLADGCSHAVAADLEVPAGAGLVLLDVFEGAGRGYVSSVEGRLRLGPGAVVERLVLCTDEAEAVSVAAFDVVMGEGARFAQTVLCAGARRQRVETDVLLAAGGELRLDGIYLLGDRRRSDQTTRVRHEGRGGRSRQLVKGLAADQSRAVFQGRIVVERGAAGADARMGAHALILGDRAEVDAKPELEIYADDVQCAHGATVGALDPESLFYARSRGIPELHAKALLAAGFVGEVVERVEDLELSALARRWLETRLEALL